MQIPFVGGAYEGRSSDINAQKCQNLFPVIDQVGGKAVVALMHTPGLTEYVDLGNSAKIRGSIETPGALWVVSGNTVFKVVDDGNVTTVTNTLSSSADHVFMAQNGSYVVIVDEERGEGFYIDTTGTTLVQITDPDFPTPSSLTFQDGYFIVTAADTGKIYISPLNDPSGDWSALDFTTAEANPDYAYIVKSLNRELWIFGNKTIEIFYNSGNADFPFERIPGSVRNKGIGAIFSVAEATDSLFFLANDYSVYQGQGTNIAKISTEQIDYQIGKLSSQDRAWGYTYIQEGHEFYVLTFPVSADNKTFVYDLTTQMWHTRATGSADNYHPVTCHWFYQNKNIVGHISNGKLYYYDFSNYTDDGNTLNRIRRTQSIFNQKTNVFHHILEVEFEGGAGSVENRELITESLDRGEGGFSGSNWTNFDCTIFTETDYITAIYNVTPGEYFYLPAINAPTVQDNKYVLTITYIAQGLTGSSFTVKSFDGTQDIATLGLSSGSGWETKSIVFTASTTGGFRVVGNGTPLAFYLDGISLKPLSNAPDPQAMLRWSDDGGHTWSNEHWAAMGKLGEYKKRARWKKLGHSRDRIYELKISDPVKVVMLSADLQYTTGVV